MEGTTSTDGFLTVNVVRVRESFESLADYIEFIATGKADDPRDEYAHECRTDAGLQLVRLRAGLNNGHVDQANCDLQTLGVLQNAWAAIKTLRYGSHSERPDQ